MWILENFYWILIVGFAILSALSKSGKSKQKQNPRGMPTFGGAGSQERRQQPVRQETPRTRQEEPMPGPEPWDPEERTYEYQGAGPDYDTGEGVSGMWEEEKPETLEDYKREMEKHLNRVNASLDRIEKAANNSAAPSAERTTYPEPVSPLAKQARNGLIWAEILGPPRSKRPFDGRK